MGSQHLEDSRQALGHSNRKAPRPSTKVSWGQSLDQHFSGPSLLEQAQTGSRRPKPVFSLALQPPPGNLSSWQPQNGGCQSAEPELHPEASGSPTR